MRVFLNGLGRIGKLVLRELLDRPGGVDLVGANDAAGDAAMHALLLERDSVHGRWHPVAAEDGALRIGDRRLPLTTERTIEALPLDDVDMVIDATGHFKTEERIAPYWDAGVSRVLVSSPVKGESALNLVYGVNHARYDGSQRLVTAASCTTNCLAPVVAVIREAFGLRHGSFTTIHDVTNTQTIADRPHKDPRRARSALTNLIPTTTGSARAIMAIFPDLEGRLDGHAVRVPLLNASLTDCAFELERAATVEEAHDAFRAAEAGRMAGILGVEDTPLVSTDYRGERRSAVIDAPSTRVVQGTHLKLYAWYDNEMGYACRMADVARMMAA